MSRSFFVKLHRSFGPKPSGAELINRLRDSVSAIQETFPIAQAQKKRRDLKVGIVGGGFAGLAAGYYLRERGVRVIVFEASDRVGGRVRTMTDLCKDRLVEAGGELIGLTHAIWLDLALKFRLGFSVLTDEKRF